MHNLTFEGIWFCILLKSTRLVGAAGRYEGTQQLKEPDLKYVNDKKETPKVLQNIFYLEHSYLFRHLKAPAISDLTSKKTLRKFLLTALNLGKFCFTEEKREAKEFKRSVMMQKIQKPELQMPGTHSNVLGVK